MPVVGSSKNIIEGFDNNSIPILTLFFSPPLIPLYLFVFYIFLIYVSIKSYLFLYRCKIPPILLSAHLFSFKSLINL